MYCVGNAGTIKTIQIMLSCEAQGVTKWWRRCRDVARLLHYIDSVGEWKASCSFSHICVLIDLCFFVGAKVFLYARTRRDVFMAVCSTTLHSLCCQDDSSESARKQHVRKLVEFEDRAWSNF